MFLVAALVAGLFGVLRSFEVANVTVALSADQDFSATATAVAQTAGLGEAAAADVAALVGLRPGFQTFAIDLAKGVDPGQGEAAAQVLRFVLFPAVMVPIGVEPPPDVIVRAGTTPDGLRLQAGVTQP